MQNWDYNLIGKYLLLFLVDGIAGYFFQFMGHSLAIHTFNRKKVVPKTFLLMTFMFAVFAYLIRKLPIATNIHTIIIMLSCILIGFLLFKTSIYQTVLAVLFTVVSITIFEGIIIFIFSLFIGFDAVKDLFAQKSIDGLIKIALMGIPVNILMITEMILLYKYPPRILKKGGFYGKKDQENS